MQELVSQAAEKADWVVLASPPVGCCRMGTCFRPWPMPWCWSFERRTPPTPTIQKAIEALGREKIAGVVLNQVERTKFPGQYGYNSYGYAKKQADGVV